MVQPKSSDAAQAERREQKDSGGGWKKMEINISTTWLLSPLSMTAGIIKRYGSREGGRNERDKKRTVK